MQSGETGQAAAHGGGAAARSGQVIRTIEGPAERRVPPSAPSRAVTDVDPLSHAGRLERRSGRHGDRTMAMQRGDRMLAITGALPSDSLLAMIRRLNAEMRSK